MTPAPTKEIAIGRKINPLASVSKRLRSASTATNKPNDTVKVVPISIHKAIHDLTEEFSAKAVSEMKGEYKVRDAGAIPRNELRKIIGEMEKQMKDAAKNLEFERAAALRDEMYELKALLAEDEKLKPWERIKLLAGEE